MHHAHPHKASDPIDNIEIQHLEAKAQYPDRIEHRDTIHLLQRIISLLPDRQREIISLSTFSGFSNEEIAQATGLSDANVRAILSRTRRRIKELFSKNL